MVLAAQAEQRAQARRLLFMISCVLFLILTLRFLGLLSAGFLAILLYSFWRLAERREREQEELARRDRRDVLSLENGSEMGFAAAVRRSGDVDGNSPISPIHPLSNFPFESSNTSNNTRTNLTADQWQEIIQRHVPSGTILKTSDTQRHADFDNEIVTVDESCPVCLVEYEHGETVLSSPSCPHVFHSHCVLAWLVQNNDCPCCRREFVPKSLIGARATIPAPATAFLATNNSNSQQQSASSSTVEEFQEPDISLGREQLHSLPHNPIFPDTLTESERREYIESLLEIGELIHNNDDSGTDTFVQADTNEEPTISVAHTEQCYICNKSYEEQIISVARSPNPYCQHFFCKDCIVPYLVHSTDCTCPRCGNTYVNETGEYNDIILDNV